MKENNRKNRNLWSCLWKLLEVVDDLLSNRTYSDYEIYGDDYQRD